MKQISVKRLVMIALFAAATTVATVLFRIPFARGYFNLGEIMIFTTALLFGPVIGGVAGAIGAALADLYAGFFLPWGPITFVLKGLEGYLVGRLGQNKQLGGKVIAVLTGGLVIIIGYPLAAALLYGWPAFLPELYMDLVQVSIGAIVAIPLSNMLQKNLVKR